MSGSKEKFILKHIKPHNLTQEQEEQLYDLTLGHSGSIQSAVLRIPSLIPIIKEDILPHSMLLEIMDDLGESKKTIRELYEEKKRNIGMDLMATHYADNLHKIVRDFSSDRIGKERMEWEITFDDMEDDK